MWGVLNWALSLFLDNSGHRHSPCARPSGPLHVRAGSTRELVQVPGKLVSPFIPISSEFPETWHAPSQGGVGSGPQAGGFCVLALPP